MKYCIYLLLAFAFTSACQIEVKNNLPNVVNEKSKLVIQKNNQVFRDLNHNGALDVYEDVTQSTENRVEDLLQQLTLEEKAGLMFINGAPVSKDADPNGRIGLTGPSARMPSVPETMDKSQNEPLQHLGHSC